MPKIHTSSGTITYKTYPLYTGVKVINKEISQENLLLLKRILDNYSIFFGLIAGTLLGAVREHDFINHDEDTDLFFLEEDKQKVFNILPEFLKNGFNIAGYDRRGLLSIIRKGEYIDLYFFSDYGHHIRICSGWCIPDKFLLNVSQYDFQGATFIIPEDYIGYLEYEYGMNWQIPIPYADYTLSNWKRKVLQLKERVKDFLPDWAYFYLASKTENRIRKKYLEKIASL